MVYTSFVSAVSHFERVAVVVEVELSFEEHK